MAEEISIEVVGLQKALDNLEKFGEEFEAELEQALSDAAFAIEGKAKEFCPVDTGRLRNSIHAVKDGHLEYHIQDGTNYGVFQEFGTSKMPAQPFLMPAVDIVIPQLEAKIDAAIKQAERSV
jgi:HK97 gp10 family phage protein